jgi:hypothetical protein
VYFTRHLFSATAVPNAPVSMVAKNVDELDGRLGTLQLPGRASGASADDE